MFKPPGRNELEVVHERDGGSDEGEEDAAATLKIVTKS